jgi:hypothetical protein
MKVRQHDADLLLASYNRQCSDCRRTIAAMPGSEAMRLLADELRRALRSRRPSRTRLQNAIAIWQSVTKREMRNGR